MKLMNVCVHESEREREREREASLESDTLGWTHYLSADKCHQLQLLGGLCCRMGERGQTGV